MHFLFPTLDRCLSGYAGTQFTNALEECLSVAANRPIKAIIAAGYVFPEFGIGIPQGFSDASFRFVAFHDGTKV